MTGGRDELARVVSYVFSTMGRRRITMEDWVKVLSLERKWLPPSKARQAAEAARSIGLLRHAGAREYEIGLEAQGWELPVDFRPDSNELEAAMAQRVHPAPETLPLFRRILRTISEKTGETETAIVAKINQSPLSGQGLIRAEVAALAYARLQGVDVSAFFDEVDSTLRRRVP